MSTLLSAASAALSQKNPGDEKYREELEKLEPRETLEFQLAYDLGRLDPGTEGVEMLSHHLANAREGSNLHPGVKTRLEWTKESLKERLKK